ncbi:casein kinase 2 regulatory subunit [Serendipita sp. 396]|nr:casein kinase 2 regulatory subunit [Serendipita sp. 396]KAG8786889.1 casein kinase 2 regulatory subunit [Serendipita sp. 397]
MSKTHPVTRSSAQHAAQAVQQQAAGDDQPMADDVQDGYASSTPTSSLTWIAWFCSLPGHEYFCEVTEDFIEDDFNLTGLSAMVPFWKEAMEMVLDVEPEDTHRIPDVSIVEASAELLYGLVHQRYILTRPGLQSMAEKYENGIFGSCLRVYCTSTRLIPCGRSDMPGVDTVKLFCPNCNDIYTPSSSRFSGVDGAFFGTTFAHLFFHTYREYAPAPFIKSVPFPATGRKTAPPISSPTHNNPNQYGGQKKPESRIYVPKIYGFKVSERAKTGPRMSWLRMRPPTYDDLNAVDSRGRWLVEHEDSDQDRNGPGGGGGRRGKFDDDDDPNEQIEEDEEEEDDAPRGPWPAQPPSGPGFGRRPVGGGGVGGRTRAALGLGEERKRRLVRKRPEPVEDNASSSECEDEYQSASETAEDSAIETPVEDGFTSSTPSGYCSITRKRRKKPELAALKLASFMGKDVREMFAGLANGAQVKRTLETPFIHENMSSGLPVA